MSTAIAAYLVAAAFRLVIFRYTPSANEAAVKEAVDLWQRITERL